MDFLNTKEAETQVKPKKNQSIKVLPAKQVPQGPAQNKKGKRAPIVEETEDQKEVTQAKLIKLKA